METTDLSSSGAFDAVQRQVTGEGRLSPAALTLGTGPKAPHLTLPEAREVLYRRGADPGARQAVWREALRLAQEEAEYHRLLGDAPVSGWRTAVVWLAIPRLRSTVRRTTAHFRVAREDVESEATLTLLEELARVEPELPGVDDLLVTAAVRSCWALATQARRERCLGDIDAALAHRPVAPPADPELVDERAWELSVNPPGRPDGLAAQLRFTVSRESAEGFRLGALAERLGLREVIHQAQQRARGPRVGTLGLRPFGARR